MVWNVGTLNVRLAEAVCSFDHLHMHLAKAVCSSGGGLIAK